MIKKRLVKKLTMACFTVVFLFTTVVPAAAGPERATQNSLIDLRQIVSSPDFADYFDVSANGNNGSGNTWTYVLKPSAFNGRQGKIKLFFSDGLLTSFQFNEQDPVSLEPEIQSMSKALMTYQSALAELMRNPSEKLASQLREIFGPINESTGTKFMGAAVRDGYLSSPETWTGNIAPFSIPGPQAKKKKAQVPEPQFRTWVGGFIHRTLSDTGSLSGWLLDTAGGPTVTKNIGKAAAGIGTLIRVLIGAVIIVSWATYLIPIKYFGVEYGRSAALSAMFQSTLMYWSIQKVVSLVFGRVVRWADHRLGEEEGVDKAVKKKSDGKSNPCGRILSNIGRFIFK